MSPGDPRRSSLTPECCFLPDLTRFGGDRRAGPELIRGTGGTRFEQQGSTCVRSPSTVKREDVTAPPLRVVFIWHFHQPWYPTFDGAPPALPWVRLHALKDYYDLPGLLSEEPRVHHTANRSEERRVGKE